MSLLRFNLAALHLVACLSALLVVTGCQNPPARVAAENGTVIFDEHTPGDRLVAAALEQARSQNRRVLLLFGANWCPYCRQLHHLLETDPQLAALVGRSFIVVPVDVGSSSRNRNTRLIDRYRATVFSDGIPALVVLAADGGQLAPTPANRWTARDPISADLLLSFLGSPQLP
ncbi:MAG TPA: hypothetical protein DCY13_10140 [Verrucomicrobiales bacterium]|nr:hypothetical protein [Verrucomicrobiales bacterium]